MAKTKVVICKIKNSFPHDVFLSRLAEEICEVHYNGILPRRKDFINVNGVRLQVHHVTWYVEKQNFNEVRVFCEIL